MNFLVSQASSSPVLLFVPEPWTWQHVRGAGWAACSSCSTCCPEAPVVQLVWYILLKIGFIILLPRMTVSFSIDLIVDEWEVWETVVAQLERPALPATEAEGHGQESRQFSCTHSCHKVHSPISWVCKESPIKLLSSSSSNWMDKNGFA